MGKWEKTTCAMCGITCGLEMYVEDNRIQKIRPDKANPRSQGYCCRKGRSSIHWQYHSDRLKYPLKRVGERGEGKWERISWDQAMTEISAKLGEILEKHGPRAFAIQGIGGQACQNEVAFGTTLLRALGSQYYYNALGMELTGFYWSYGRAMGKQWTFCEPDEEGCDVLVAWGWNPYVTHQMTMGKRTLNAISKDPNRKLVAIDPRLSETAKIADVHMHLRPGSDALFIRTIIAIILEKGWQHQGYLDEHVLDFDKIRPWFEDFDIEGGCRVCELSYEEMLSYAHLFSHSKWAMHTDLGVLCNRHSTLVTSLQIVLLAVCGRLLVEGGNVAYGFVVPWGSHSDEREERHWRTPATNYGKIMNMYPPNIIPEEVLNDRPDRLRAMILTQCNPLRSCADTTAQTAAYKHLELLVVDDVAMTETASIADYVLPGTTGYESYDASYYAWTYPKIYFCMKHPVVKPEWEQKELGEFWMLLADKMGIIPEIPDYLYEAAKKSRPEYAKALLGFFAENPKAAKMPTFIIGKTLGKEMGSVHKAWIWGILMLLPKSFHPKAARVGYKPGPMLGDQLFQELIDHPEGRWVGEEDPADQMLKIQHKDKKIHLFEPELNEWLKEITPEQEDAALNGTTEFPMTLQAGRHIEAGMNGLMRNPYTHMARNPCALAIHPDDAKQLGVADGQMVRVVTDSGSVEIETQYTYEARKGFMMIPHHFGFTFDGKSYGVGVNKLTNKLSRDRIAGTPFHHNVKCRIEPISEVIANGKI